MDLASFSRARRAVGWSKMVKTDVCRRRPVDCRFRSPASVGRILPTATNTKHQGCCPCRRGQCGRTSPLPAASGRRWPRKRLRPRSKPSLRFPVSCQSPKCTCPCSYFDFKISITKISFHYLLRGTYVLAVTCISGMQVLSGPQFFWMTMTSVLDGVSAPRTGGKARRLRLRASGDSRKL